MALLGRTEAVAGTIGGVSFKELPGSGAMDFDEEGVRATRVFRIAWSDRYTFVAALTPLATQLNMDLVSSYSEAPWIFPGWPGNPDAVQNAYRSRLMVKSIHVEPAHGGKTPGITTNSSTNMVEYDEAEVTVEYGLDVADKRSTEWQLVANEVRERGAFTFGSGASAAPADVSVLFPMQEFSWRLSGWKITAAENDSIRSTNAAILTVGRVNDDNITVYNGTTKYTFKSAQVRMDSYEVQPRLWFGRLKHDIVYRFRVCPGLYGGKDYETSATWDHVTWMHAFDPDPDQNKFRIVSPDPYEQTSFNDLVPWEIYEGGEREDEQYGTD